MGRREIPAAAIAVCAEFIAERETHAELDNLFSYAGAPGDGEYGLQYARGGYIVPNLGVPTRTLQQFIQDRDLAAIENEFDRAGQNTENEPREAISSASNILESVCKVYIEDKDLEMPSKQDLQSVWWRGG